VGQPTGNRFAHHEQHVQTGGNDKCRSPGGAMPMAMAMAMMRMTMMRMTMGVILMPMDVVRVVSHQAISHP
jgi:hypothetical protein